MKTAIIILSDPKAGSDEALGRLFNGLAAAHDFRAKDIEVSILFQGAGTRWIGVLADKEHYAHGLFQEVKDLVAGVSHGCADAFGATEDVERSGFDLLTDNPLPGTSGLPSLAKLTADGYTVLTF